MVDPEVLKWPKSSGIPVCELSDGRKVLIIFHLFSGRRRHGDCHHWAEHLIEEYFPGYGVLMLSLDTAVGGEHCNLLDGPGLGFAAPYCIGRAGRWQLVRTALRNLERGTTSSTSS